MVSPDTRERLILAAEQLFAERGIEPVSLREINLAAGQRNTSASHYHFGSKEALIEAIFEYRRPVLIERRNRSYQTLVEEGQGRDLRSLVGAMVQSLAQEVEPNAPGRHYVPFLARLWQEPPAGKGALFSRLETGNEKLHGPIRAVLSHLPPHLLLRRLLSMSRHVPVALTDYVRMADRDAEPMPLADYVADLTDTVTAYLAAPIGPVPPAGSGPQSE